MQSQEKNNLIIARLFPGENIFERLKFLCQKRNVKMGIVLSGVGQLSCVEVGFFKEKGDYLPQKFESPLEVLSISGIISADKKDEYDFHLHISLSDENKKSIGGHFISGIVSVTLEIAILKTEIEVKREVEEKTGLRGMFFD